MPYTVNFSDKENKSAIVVYDNTSSTDTSLKFPGRNVTGYGQIIAENFLHLLENFSSATEPTNPVEGQLWYDSNSGTLMIYDNVDWKAASNIRKSTNEPSVDPTQVGELWVDTIKQQLYIWSGTTWILVGPIFSTADGLRTGPVVEIVDDSDNVSRSIIKYLVKEEPVAIISKDTFTPKITIPGFVTVKTGITMSSIGIGDNSAIPKLYGTAQSADGLSVGSTIVSSTKFLRSDTANTTEYGINIKSNSGITIGVDGNFRLSSSSTAASIYNATQGSSLDLQVNRSGDPTTIIRVADNKVGINTLTPSQALDVTGNVQLSGNLIVTGTDISTNLNNGSIRTAGGLAVSQNVLIGTDLNVLGNTTTNTILPSTNETYNLGSNPTGTEVRAGYLVVGEIYRIKTVGSTDFTLVGATSNSVGTAFQATGAGTGTGSVLWNSPSATGGKRWDTIYARSIQADRLDGVLYGDISGNANSANVLRQSTTFRLEGDVISDDIVFNGSNDGSPKVFNTTFTADIIASKEEPFPNKSDDSDMILVYRPSAVSETSNGLLKESRDVFIADLGVPIGAIMPFAGINVPDGYLLCDGSEVERAKYSRLYDAIGSTYGLATLGVNTFKLPDLRGRFALGRDNMDNDGTVPVLAGGYVDAGGGTAGRVTDTNATTLGGSGGDSTNSLTVGNLPEHEHTMKPPGVNKQFYGIRVDSSTVSGTSLSTSGNGPTAPGQAQYLSTSGGIKTSVTLGSPFAILNPYLTINYIIRSGPPAF